MAQTMFGKLMAKIGETLGLLKERSVRLTSQRDAAKTSLEKAMAAVQAHLLDGDADDVKALGVLQLAVDRASSLLASLDAAIAEQARRVADAERALADEATKAACKAASEALAADVAKMEQQLAPWLESTRSLASELEKYSTFRFEAGGIARFLNNAAAEIEIALGVTIPDFKSAIAAVAEGREAPPSQPAPIVKFVAAKPPPTETVFFLRAAKWSDDKGFLHLIQKFTDASLPPSLAAHAIKVGAAVEWKSPLRKQNRGTWNGRPFHAEHCFALDAASETHDPVLHSAFTPVARGPAYNITVPVQRAPMVAARDMPTKK
jgi:hypothetical protein